MAELYLNQDELEGGTLDEAYAQALQPVEVKRLRQAFKIGKHDANMENRPGERVIKWVGKTKYQKQQTGGVDKHGYPVYLKTPLAMDSVAQERYRKGLSEQEAKNQAYTQKVNRRNRAAAAIRGGTKEDEKVFQDYMTETQNEAGEKVADLLAYTPIGLPIVVGQSLRDWYDYSNSPNATYGGKLWRGAMALTGLAGIGGFARAMTMPAAAWTGLTARPGGLKYTPVRYYASVSYDPNLAFTSTGTFGTNSKLTVFENATGRSYHYNSPNVQLPEGFVTIPESLVKRAGSANKSVPQYVESYAQSHHNVYGDPLTEGEALYALSNQTPDMVSRAAQYETLNSDYANLYGKPKMEQNIKDAVIRTTKRSQTNFNRFLRSLGEKPVEWGTENRFDAVLKKINYRYNPEIHHNGATAWGKNLNYPFASTFFPSQANPPGEMSFSMDRLAQYGSAEVPVNTSIQEGNHSFHITYRDLKNKGGKSYDALWRAENAGDINRGLSLTGALRLPYLEQMGIFAEVYDYISRHNLFPELMEDLSDFNPFNQSELEKIIKVKDGILRPGENPIEDHIFLHMKNDAGGIMTRYKTIALKGLVDDLTKYNSDPKTRKAKAIEHARSLVKMAGTAFAAAPVIAGAASETETKRYGGRLLKHIMR